MNSTGKHQEQGNAYQDNTLEIMLQREEKSVRVIQ